jgi:hypothetical protein
LSETTADYAPVATWAEFTHAEIAEHLDLALLGFCACEIAVRVALALKRRQFDGWLLVDAIIVGVALLPLGASLPIVRAGRLAHLGRHGMLHLRHITIARGFQLAH